MRHHGHVGGLPLGRPAPGPWLPCPWRGFPGPTLPPTSVSLPCLQGSLLGTVPEGGGQRSPSTPSKQKRVRLGSCPVSPDSGHHALLPARPRPGHPSRQSTPWHPAGLAWDRLLSATWAPISQLSRHSPPPTEGAGLDSRQERARGSGASAQVCGVPTGLPSGPPRTEAPLHCGRAAPPCHLPGSHSREGWALPLGALLLVHPNVHSLKLELNVHEEVHSARCPPCHPYRAARDGARAVASPGWAHATSCSRALP